MRSKTTIFFITFVFLFATMTFASNNDDKKDDKANGCGTEKSDKFIPDKPLGFDFTDACNNHDICYSTEGKGKETCDTQFKSDMDQVCENETGIKRGICKTVSSIYHISVKKGGGDAYDNAQENNKDKKEKNK